MLRKFFKASAFSLIEVSAVLIIIGVLIAGVLTTTILVNKSRVAAAKSLTKASPIHDVKDSALWLETSVESSFNDSEADNGRSISGWFDSRNVTNKNNISAVGAGPVYSNTINSIHAIRFAGSASNYLQIDDASFLNNSDYTIFLLEQRDASTDTGGNSNYLIGDSTVSDANQSLLLGYSGDQQIVHSQGIGNSYTSSVTGYSNSKNKPRVFTFVQDSTSGKKTYINGVLAAQSSDTTQLRNISSLAIGKGYAGQIGEIAIFTRALKTEERTAIEDYAGKKWTSKINRDAVEASSCVGYTITDYGCDLSTAPCNAVSVAGVSSPISAASGVGGTVSCDVAHYSGASISYSCNSGSLTSGTCGCATGYLNPNCSTCDAANNYITNGSGGCVLSAPVNSVAPSLSSTSPIIGTSISVNNGTWSPAATSHSYQWHWGDTGAAISGATSSSYTPVVGDATHTLLCKVTAINSGGSSTATSSNTSSAIAGIPANSAAPTLSSTSAVSGIALSVSNGTWSPTPSSYSYQWYRNNTTVISGATSASYTPVAEDVGNTLLCKVSANSPAGSSSPVSSNTSSAVTAPTPTTIYLTSGTTWTVPAGWISGANTIEVIGGGGGGAADLSSSGAGGGGGAYSKITNLTLTAGTTISYSVGAGGTAGYNSGAGSAGGDTWFNGSSFSTSSVAAKGGTGGNATTAGVGGSSSSGIGSAKYSGGNGGSGENYAGGGGGGSAGPNGNGAAGGAGGGINAAAGGGGGGGGTVGGNAGNTTSGLGGLGANSSGTVAGTGGTNTSSGTVSGGAGSASSNSSGGGGGGGGGVGNPPGSGGNGGAGKEWDTTRGSGGGGGGAGDQPGGSNSTAKGGNGGLYGGGGGGSGADASNYGGTGGQGIIVIKF